MAEYNLTIRRTVTVAWNTTVEGDSPEDAAQRFQHQLEARQCSAVEDDEMWGEAFYYQVAKADPYTGEYAVMDAEPV